jgi:voltage-dependent potassium channel beta subunit
MEMQYRRLGRSGLKVSLLSFGSWVSFGNQLDTGKARDCMAAAYEGGVNFFDNAEIYANGESETIMGKVIAELKWPRYSYVLSSKFYWGIDDSVNTKRTLNRKYLMHAVERSLERLNLDFLDLIFCHRPDPDTPVEETVWAMHDIISSGRAHYWGTSEWSADAIAEAWNIAEQHHLHKPLMEQPQYNLLHRENVEVNLAPLCEATGLGLTTWSPLASGLLTGKYLDGIPEGSRATLPGYEWIGEMVTDKPNSERVRKLKVIADRLGVPLAQMALAWCASNPNVSTVITGASTTEQVRQNLKALDVLELLTQPVLAEIDEAVA